MPHVGPIKRKDLIYCLKLSGFEGPYSGGKHQFMVKGSITLSIPNPHRGDISAKSSLPESSGRQGLAEEIGRIFSLSWEFQIFSKKELTKSRGYSIVITQTRELLARLDQCEKCGSGSVVEHFLAKEDVAGSNPVSRSHFSLQGDVAKW